MIKRWLLDRYIEKNMICFMQLGLSTSKILSMTWEDMMRERLYDGMWAFMYDSFGWFIIGTPWFTMQISDPSGALRVNYLTVFSGIIVSYKRNKYRRDGETGWCKQWTFRKWEINLRDYVDRSKGYWDVRYEEQYDEHGFLYCKIGD